MCYCYFGDVMVSEIIKSVVINIFTVISTVVLIAIVYFIVYEMQHSKFMKDLRRFIRPAKRVFVTDKIPTKFSVQSTKFHRVLSDEEQRSLLSFENKVNLFNGKNTIVRCLRYHTLCMNTAI